ncbi:hypothetical protein BT69DRAFT_1357065 [Atractiella rhizophila]|nr:hypothetical protein BT69DRAFT_1357065 [Atractiella rhizophila]
MSLPTPTRKFSNASVSALPPHMRNNLASPPLSATGTSVLDLNLDNAPPVIISRKDQAASFAAFDNLMSSAKALRNCMLAMSQATASFATALQDCGRLKGAGTTESREQLLTFSGFYYMQASTLWRESSMQALLADSFYRNFELELLDKGDEHKHSTMDRNISHQKILTEKTRLIQKTEADNLKMGRKGIRDLTSFRNALTHLQVLVQDMDRCKVEHYKEALASEEELWSLVSNKAGITVRSSLDIHERLSSKGNTDPHLASLNEDNPDPFAVYEDPNTSSAQYQTILSPLSLLPSTMHNHPHRDPELARGLDRSLNNVTEEEEEERDIAPRVLMSPELKATLIPSSVDRTSSDGNEFPWGDAN